jgi:hypothetical protein
MAMAFSNERAVNAVTEAGMVIVFALGSHVHGRVATCTDRKIDDHR